MAKHILDYLDEEGGMIFDLDEISDRTKRIALRLGVHPLCEINIVPKNTVRSPELSGALATVSTLHAFLFRVKDQSYSVQDWSKNGVSINRDGAKITVPPCPEGNAVPLINGDQLFFGDYGPFKYIVKED